MYVNRKYDPVLVSFTVLVSVYDTSISGHNTTHAHTHRHTYTHINMCVSRKSRMTLGLFPRFFANTSRVSVFNCIKTLNKITITAKTLLIWRLVTGGSLTGNNGGQVITGGL